MTHYFFVKTKFIVTEKARFLVNKISNITGGRKIKVRKKQKAIFFLNNNIFFVL